MRDDADALQSEQGRTAIFGMVEPFLEISKCAAREQVSDLPGHCGLQRFFQIGANQIDHAFGNLQRDVANKAVGDNDVDIAVVKVAPFDVADKFRGSCLRS